MRDNVKKSLYTYFEGELPIEPEYFNQELLAHDGDNFCIENQMKYDDWLEEDYCLCCGSLTPKDLDSHHSKCYYKVGVLDMRKLEKESPDKVGTPEQRMSDITCTVADGKLNISVGLNHCIRYIDNYSKTFIPSSATELIEELEDTADNVESYGLMFLSEMLEKLGIYANETDEIIRGLDDE